MSLLITIWIAITVILAPFAIWIAFYPGEESSAGGNYSYSRDRRILYTPLD